MKSSENANEIKKVTLIKFFLYIVFIGISFCYFAQSTNIDQTWKKEKDKIEYRKAKNYKGPKDWNSDRPATIQKDDNEDLYIPQNGAAPNSANSPSGSQTYTPQQIEEERQKRYGKNYNGGGTGKPDPELIKPDPIEFPEFDSPDIDAPDVDLPEVDTPDFLTSAGFWKTLLFLLLFFLAIWIIYILIKNKRPSNKKVIVQNVENDWHPEIITKTQLEIMLEKAVNEENYRECVRIYFMFILKELTKKGWIKWRAEKTNYDYLMELRSKGNVEGFEASVKIYDLVWYGDYHIDQSSYQQLQPTLVKYYKSLNPSDDN